MAEDHSPRAGPGSATPRTTQSSPASARARAPASRGRRSLPRAMFYAHLWLGVLGTGILIVVAVTGILLNHKRGLGLMPDVEHQPTAAFTEALPLAQLARTAESAVTPEVAAAGVDRMDVRPRSGLVKVRFRDARVVEVTVDLASGRVLHVGERNDVFLEKLHSGEIFGDRWVLLSDFGALVLLVTLVSGYWLWLYPKSRQT